jgi:hypothetical protein
MSTAEPLPVITGEVAANQHTRNPEIVPFVPNHMLTYKKVCVADRLLEIFPLQCKASIKQEMCRIHSNDLTQG